MLVTLWQFRYFVLASIAGEFRGRYSRSRLGLLWSILHPLAQATIFAVVLGEILGAKLGIDGKIIDNKVAYPIYLMSGMAAWSLFSEILQRCVSIFIEYAGPMKKISFPRLCLPLIVLGGALLNQLLLLLAILVVFLCFGHLPGVAWIALPLGICFVSVFAFGLGVMLGVINVFVRDVGQVVTVLLQIWFWLTPIVYTVNALPPQLRWLVSANPLTPMVRIYNDALLFNQFPELSTLLLPTLIALVFFALSFMLFRRASAEIVDVL